MKINSQLNLSLHSKQKEIHNSKARYKVIKAGKRFGKTLWVLYELVRAAGQYNNKTFWYIAPTYGQAKGIAWSFLLNIIPPSLIKRKSEHDLLIQLVTGSIIQLKGAENEDSLRGVQLFGVIFDEAAYIKEDIWGRIISGQLVGAGEGSFAYFISSPNRFGRNWFSEFFTQAERLKKAGNKDWDCFYFTFLDNPLISDEEKKFVQSQNTDSTWNLEYMAMESDFTGLAVKEFNQDIHAREIKEEEGWIYVRGIDWGIDHPTVCLWIGIDLPNRRVFVKDEFVSSGKLISDSSVEIKGRYNHFYEWSVIDPSTNKRNSQTGLTDRDEFARHGVYCLVGDNNFRGWDIMRLFFQKNMIYIHPRCKNLISELKTYNMGDKLGDDCLDSLRYVLVRIHDTMFNFKEQLEPQSPLANLKPNEVSFFDRRLFPEEQKQAFNWLSEEVA